MKMTKKGFITLILIAFLAFSALSLTACNNKVYYVDVLINADMPLDGGDIVIEFTKNGEEKITVVMNPGETTSRVDGMATGEYSVVVNRYGIIENTNINLDKDNPNLDFSLFQNSIVDEVGTHYLISDKAQFARIAKFSGIPKALNYRLASDIDFAGTACSMGNFTGVLDGDGKVIKNLSISNQDTNVGLANTNNGTIKNIRFENCNVKANKNVGVVAGANNGAIWDIFVVNSKVEGADYVGGVAGVDYGDISNSEVSSTEVKSVGHYGRVAGVSFSNITLGAYGLKPTIAGIKPINSGMTAKQMLKTVMENWTALENRSKMVTGNFNISFGALVANSLPVIASYPGIDPALAALLNPNIINTAGFNIDAYGEAKMMYKGAKSAENLGEGMVIGSGYAVASPIQDTINFLLPMLKEMELVDKNLELNLLFNPISGAAYYDSTDDYLSFTLADSSKVGKGGQVASDFSDTLYWLNLEKDIEEIVNDIGLEQAILQMFFDYIAIAKSYFYMGAIDKMIEVAVDKTASVSAVNGVYTLTFEVDPVNFMNGSGGLITQVNDEIAKAEETIRNTYPNGIGKYVGYGNHVDANYKGKKWVLKAEVFDNGNIKALSLDNVEMDLELKLTQVFKDYIVSEAKKSAQVDPTSILNSLKIGLKTVKTPIVQLYSYSATDYDVDLYKGILSGNKSWVVDEYYDFDER